MGICALCGSDKLISVQPKIDFEDVSALYQKQGIYFKSPSRTIDYNQCSECKLGQFSPSIVGDEQLYEQLQQNDWYYLTEKEEYDIASRHVRPGDRVLDIGAGRAYFAHKIGGFERYLGLEFNSVAIREAAKKGIQLQQISIQDFAKTSDSVFDVVATFQVLEHVEDPIGFLKSAVRVLRPGGTLIIAVPNNSGIAGMSLNNALNMPPHHQTHWSRETIERASQLLNMSVVEIVELKLEPLHRQWYAKTCVENFLRKRMGFSKRIIDRSMPSQIVSKIASALALVLRYIPIQSPRGHTIVGVLAKPKNISSEAL